MSNENAKRKWSSYVMSKILQSSEYFVASNEELGIFLGGFSRETVRQWMNAEALPTANSLLKIKRKFPEDDLDWIFEEVSSV